MDTEQARLTDALGHGVADKRIDILRAIARTGSISQAARDVAVSYKAAWQAVDTLTNLAGVPLVEKAVGGVGGGGALLTLQGQHLLALANALEQARQQVQARWADGSVPGGPQAYAGLSRLSLRTSMRNQLPCTVVSMEVAGRIVRVGMQLGACAAEGVDSENGPQRGQFLPDSQAHSPAMGQEDGGKWTAAAHLQPTSLLPRRLLGDDNSARMTARITTESAELLGLAVGMTVIVLCKATAVRVQPHKATRTQPTGNQLVGQVTDVALDEGGDEVTVQLAGGLQLVGFAPAGVGMVPGQQARVEVDEAAVVVALPG